jgi:two-component system sensor histidine kinase YesM
MQMGLLSSQMDAHLVFNTLANIESLSDIGENEKSAQMANGLAILLRHQNKGDTMTNVLKEFSVLEKYIMLMNIRHDGKYRYDYDLDDNLSDCLMPGFILQPIVENALMHGFGGEYVEPRLAIKGSIQGDKIRIEVSDNGAGIPLDKLKAIRDSLERYEIDDFPDPGLQGVALPNIQRRIRLQFGNEYGIGIDSDLGEGTTVTVVLPHICDTDNPAQILG